MQNTVEILGFFPLTHKELSYYFEWQKLIKMVTRG